MDKYLIEAAEGNQEAFSHLFYAYKDKVYTVALRLTEASVLAEEVVQEVFIKLWVNREALAEVRSFDDYLFIVTRNYVFAAMKKIAHRQRTEVSWRDIAPTSENLTENTLLNQEYEVVLQNAIAQLSPQQRQVYLLSRDQNLKRDEIAQMLNVSPETVKTHQARALQSIRSYCAAQLGMKLPLGLLLLAGIF
ncbi:RNA polymerase sigma-70 factor [Ravibacter arvi]|uniref:RNA polymerase sigma-70 factor n=1 Tax=Ravibacter arvi TaxID=2051041 RepID=A0ABP8M6N5_9BACT